MTPQIQPAQTQLLQAREIDTVSFVLKIFQDSPLCVILDNYSWQYSPPSNNINVRSILLIVEYLPWERLITRICVGIILLPFYVLPSKFRPGVLKHDPLCFFKRYQIINIEAYCEENVSWENSPEKSQLKDAINKKNIELIKDIGDTTLKKGALSKEFFHMIAPLYKNVQIQQYAKQSTTFFR